MTRVKRTPKQKGANHKPSDGERWAVRGFTVQYLLAANIAYEQLSDDTLEWIAVADPDAGRVDDFQLCTGKEVRAYQFKWHEHAPALTFADLAGARLSPSDGLLSALSSGWHALTKLHPGKRVVVHLVTNASASVSDRPGAKTSAHPKHMSAFLSEIWHKKGIWQEGDLPARWQLAYRRARQATGLNATQFERFRQSCRIQVSQSLPNLISRDAENSESNRRIQDIVDLANELQRIVAFDRTLVRLQKTDLLHRLRWGARWTYNSPHYFPVSLNYEPIQPTLQALEQLLKRIDQGYICLSGTPGSGKSTLLSQTFRYRSDIQTYLYYCFVPNTVGNRAEAYSFLHDVTLALWKDGVRPSKASLGTTIEESRACLHHQLAHLNNLWLQSGRKAVILVDGLDHVERENNPQHSLIKELPIPDALPQGVIIALGTQTLELPSISPSIVAQLQRDNRTIKIDCLDRASIRAIVDKSELPLPVNEKGLRALQHLSKGHPLALSYLINRLRNTTSASDVQEVLANAPPYDDRIEEQYQKFWLTLSDTEALRYQLALLCRIRIPFAPDDESWPQSGVPELSRRAKHYFTRDSTGRWSFFHNSFRQFLLDRTSRTSFAQEFSSTENRKHHLELASLAAKMPRPFAYERLYHLHEAGEAAQVTDCSSQLYFRSQYFEGRPPSAIRDDIALAMHDAASQRNTLAVIRLLLIDEEISERATIRGDVKLRETLLDLGDVEAAKAELELSSLSDDASSITKALEFATKLFDRGFIRDAREVVDAAEPLDLLKGARKLGDFDGQHIRALEAWVPIAARTRTVESITSSLLSLEFKIETPGNARRQGQEEAFREDVLRRLFWLLIIALHDTRRSTAIVELTERLRADGSNKLADDLCVISELEHIRRNLGDSTNEKKIIKLEEKARRLGSLKWLWFELAEHRLFNQQNPTAARAIEKRLHFKPSLSLDKSGSDGVPAYNLFIRTVRFHAGLGNPPSLTSVIDDLPSRATDADRIFTSCLCRIATIWGSGLSGRALESATVVQELRNALLLTETSKLRRGRPLDWYSFSRIRPYYYAQILYAALAHGRPAAESVFAFLVHRWSTAQSTQFWSLDIRRQIAALAYSILGDDAQLLEILRTASSHQELNLEIHDHLRELSEQADNWQKLGFPHEARALLTTILQHGYGIYHDKDTQLDEWLLWIPELLKLGTTSSTEDARWLVHSLANAAAQNKGHRPHQTAVDTLLQISVLRPALANDIRRCMLELGALTWAEGATAFLLGMLSRGRSSSQLPLSLFERVCLPLLKHLPNPIRDTFVEICDEISLQADGEHRLRALARAIDTECTENDAASWHSLATSESTKEIVQRVFRKGKSSEPNESAEQHRELNLIDGSIIPAEALLRQIASPDALLELCRKADPNQYFNWDGLLTEMIIANLPIEHLTQVGMTLSGHKGALNSVLKIAERLSTDGEKTLAEELLKAQCLKGERYGWIRYMDGGTRLLPFQRLVILDSKHREIAVTQFVKDYLGGARSPRESVRSMRTLVDLFWQIPPYEDVWREVKQHLEQLVEFQVQVPTAWPSFSCTDATAEDATQEFLLECFRKPSPELRTYTFAAVSNFISHTNDVSALADCVSALLRSDGEEVAIGLATIHHASKKDLNFGDAFAPDVAALLAHDDMALRLLAEQVVHQLNLHRAQPLLLPKVGRRPLPFTYEMELPDFPIARTIPFEGTLLPDGILRETVDPIELTSLISEELQSLARWSGISWRNLVERCVTLMSQSSVKWDSNSERRIQNEFRAVALETSFRRPRSAAVFEALGKLVAELFDAERIDARIVRRLQPALAIVDVDIADCIPEPMPSTSFQLGDSRKEMWRANTWLSELATLQPSWPRLNDSNCTLVAFATMTSIPTWERLEETWLGTLQFDRYRSTQPGSPQLHYSTMSITASTYESIAATEQNLRYLAIRKSNFRTEIPQTTWLALNPGIAKILGWSKSCRQPFEWMNSRNEIVAGSRYWRSGRLSRMPPDNGTALSGWAVWMSSQGLMELKTHFGGLQSAQWIERSLQNSESNQRSSASKSVY